MSVIIPIKSPLKVKRAIKCSFCGEIRPCVESIINRNSICYFCHQSAQEILGIIPTGAVSCLHCHKHDSIVVEMINNTIIHYKSNILDIQGVILYNICMFKGSYKEKLSRKRAWCDYCKKEIPLYLLSRSSYIL